MNQIASDLGFIVLWLAACGLIILALGVFAYGWEKLLQTIERRLRLRRS